MSDYCLYPNQCGIGMDCSECMSGENARLQSEVERLRGRCVKYENIIAAVLSDLEIMDEASGVAGYHLNGEIATWDEVGWQFMRDALKEASEKFEFAQRPTRSSGE